MRTHDTAEPASGSTNRSLPANYDELIHPEQYRPTLQRLKQALPRVAVERLEQVSASWLERDGSDMLAWLQERKREEEDFSLWERELYEDAILEAYDDEMEGWLQQRKRAEHEVERHSSRFHTDAPLAYNLYFPPPAPWPPGDSLQSVLKLIPGHLRKENGVDVLIAEGMRLDALNYFLLREQKDIVEKPKFDYNFLVQRAESGGLGVTYGVSVATGPETAKQRAERKKAEEEIGQRQRKKRRKRGLLGGGTDVFDPISLDRMLNIITAMENARDAERNAGLAAAGISRAFRR